MTIKNMDGDGAIIADLNSEVSEVVDKKHKEKGKYRAENIVEQFLEEGNTEQQLDWEE